jgi:hypothetical protein
MTGSKESGDGRVLVRATVSLAGLGVGQEARVDPHNPYITGLLAGEYLVPVDRPAHEDSPGDAAP